MHSFSAMASAMKLFLLHDDLYLSQTHFMRLGQWQLRKWESIRNKQFEKEKNNINRTLLVIFLAYKDIGPLLYNILKSLIFRSKDASWFRVIAPMQIAESYCSYKISLNRINSLKIFFKLLLFTTTPNNNCNDYFMSSIEL